MKTKDKMFFVSLCLVLLSLLIVPQALAGNVQLGPGHFRSFQVSSLTDYSPGTSNASSTLPSSLQSIERDAFSGTGLTNIALPENLEHLGERAFADNPSLLFLYIPASTKDIGEALLSGARSARVIAEKESVAHTWTQRNGVPFSRAVLLREKKVRNIVAISLPVRENYLQISIAEKQNIDDTTKTPRLSEGREISELKTPRLNGTVNEYIQSRYFP